MAMVACRECKESVSSGAEICPSCGVIAPAGTAGRRIAGLIYFALIGLLFYWVWGLMSP